QIRQADALSSELECGRQHTQSVSYTAPEVDRGRFLKILSGARYFPDAETEVYALCQHLVIENEVVRILEQRQFCQYLAAEGAITGVVFKKVYPQKKILKRGEQAVRDVLIKRHPPAQRPPAADPGSQHHIVDSVGNHARHSGDQQRSVLVI